MKNIICLILLIAALNVKSSAQVWNLEGPASRHSHTAVFDPSSGEMIIFGGQQTITNTDLSDVWLGNTSTNQNDSFQQLFPLGSPPPGRYGHVAAYDSSSNRMMIFGGAEGTPSPCANDVWVLFDANGHNGSSSWIQEATSGNTPAARVYSAGVYDPSTNTLIVFGGNDCSSGYFADVWVLANANGLTGTPVWSQLQISGNAPTARESASAIYDSTNNTLTIYGGDAGGTPFGDVWVLSGANGKGAAPSWTQLTPSGTPPAPRTGHTAIYNSADDRMTIFGGTNGTHTLSDSWVLTSANGIGTPSWQKITVSGTAPSLSYQSAVYDQPLNQMYVFAGSSSADKLQTNSHAFTLSAGNGISSKGIRWILGGPAVRYSQSIFYDSTTNSLFVFGGQHSRTNIDFGDYWQATNVLGSFNLEWSMPARTGTPPSGRFGHTGEYDSGSNRMMIFGGATGFPAPCVNDYHILENANTTGGTPTWIKVSPSGALPPIRALQGSAYDSVSNTLIIFGGFDCTSTFYNDVWILKNANGVTGTPTWTQLSPSGTKPSARESSSTVYDPTTNTLIVYGGDANSTVFGDIWLLSNANGSGGTPVWTQLTPSNKGPKPRTGHTAIYDVQNNRMVIYAGIDGTSVLNDVWILSGANGQAGSATWTASVSGQIRRYHSSVYDPVSNEMITFGGQSGSTSAMLVPISDIYTLIDANGLP
jgi:hypothetical protein